MRKDGKDGQTRDLVTGQSRAEQSRGSGLNSAAVEEGKFHVSVSLSQ